MIDPQQNIVEKIFSKRSDNGLWKQITKSNKYYPDYLHYVPNYKATLWTLLLLADLECDASDGRVVKPLQVVKDHLYDDEYGIYSLKEDHFPIPCLNGNMLFLDCYFMGSPMTEVSDFCSSLVHTNVLMMASTKDLKINFAAIRAVMESIHATGEL